MTGEEAVDYCMKEFKISDFKEEDSDLTAEEARNVKLLQDLKCKKKISENLESKTLEKSQRFEAKQSESLKLRFTESYGMVRPSEESSDKSTGTKII